MRAPCYMFSHYVLPVLRFAPEIVWNHNTLVVSNVGGSLRGRATIPPASGPVQRQDTCDVEETRRLYHRFT